MKWVYWYYERPDGTALKVISRDLCHPPLEASREPVDCEVMEVPDDKVIYGPSL